MVIIFVLLDKINYNVSDIFNFIVNIWFLFLYNI